MNRPKAPPRAKPIPPDITVFAGQLSIAACICHRDQHDCTSTGEAFRHTALTMAASWSLMLAVLPPRPPPPPPGMPGKFIFRVVACVSPRRYQNFIKAAEACSAYRTFPRLTSLEEMLMGDRVTQLSFGSFIFAS